MPAAEPPRIRATIAQPSRMPTSHAAAGVVLSGEGPPAGYRSRVGRSRIARGPRLPGVDQRVGRSRKATDARGRQADVLAAGTSCPNGRAEPCVPLYDQTTSIRPPATAPIKLQLCDSAGVNLSSPDIRIELVALELVGGVSIIPEDSGHANPDGFFRYDATLGGSGGYTFALSTSGLEPGTYLLRLAVDGVELTTSLRLTLGR